MASRIGIEIELQGLPAFRTLGARLDRRHLYVKDCGLYTETRLADEMGLYADDPRAGWACSTPSRSRAARLVVKNYSMHAMGWTRPQAIDFMHDRGPRFPIVDAEIEVDRCTVLPPPTFLVPTRRERQIERARAEVSQTIGDRFDLHEFYDDGARPPTRSPSGP